MAGFEPTTTTTGVWIWAVEFADEFPDELAPRATCAGYVCAAATAAAVSIIRVRCGERGTAQGVDSIQSGTHCPSDER